MVHTVLYFLGYRPFTPYTGYALFDKPALKKGDSTARLHHSDYHPSECEMLVGLTYGDFEP